MTVREIIVPRKAGRGGAYMRVRVCRSRRCIKAAVRRMHARGAPLHHIARCLAVPRAAIRRILSRQIWRG